MGALKVKQRLFLAARVLQQLTRSVHVFSPVSFSHREELKQQSPGVSSAVRIMHNHSTKSSVVHTSGKIVSSQSAGAKTHSCTFKNIVRYTKAATAYEPPTYRCQKIYAKRRIFRGSSAEMEKQVMQKSHTYYSAGRGSPTSTKRPKNASFACSGFPLTV